jgi:hypothetical protein
MWTNDLSLAMPITGDKVFGDPGELMQRRASCIRKLGVQQLVQNMLRGSHAVFVG